MPFNQVKAGMDRPWVGVNIAQMFCFDKRGNLDTNGTELAPRIQEGFCSIFISAIRSNVIMYGGGKHGENQVHSARRC